MCASFLCSPRLLRAWLSVGSCHTCRQGTESQSKGLEQKGGDALQTQGWEGSGQGRAS